MGIRSQYLLFDDRENHCLTKAVAIPSQKEKNYCDITSSKFVAVLHIIAILCCRALFGFDSA